MSDAFEALADAAVHGQRSFTVAADHVTAAFGEHADPPGQPAATDVGPADAVALLGTSHLLARFESVARESLRGHLPDGTGVVERSVSVSHLAPVSVGSEVAVSTTLVAVDRPDLSFACRAECGDGTAVATGDLTFSVVERDRFRERVDRVCE